MTSIYTFAAPWLFTPVGRAELVAAFSSSLASRDARILNVDSDDENGFTLQCNEQAFNEFVLIAKWFIERQLHLEREVDMFEENKVIRVNGTSASSKTASTKQHLRTEPHFTLFTHENVNQTWTPKQNDGCTSFSTTTTIIGKIQSLASVRIEGSVGDDDLTVRGDSHLIVSNAIRKLDTLEETMAQPANIHNHVMLEGTTFVKLQFLPLKDVPDARLRTTLLAAHSPFVRNLRKANVVVIIRNGEVAWVTATFRSEAGEYLWKDHELTVQIPSIQALKIGPAKTPIGRWVEESSTATVIDPFAPSTNIEIFEESPKPASPEPSPPKPSTRRTRMVKGKEASNPGDTVDSTCKAPFEPQPSPESTLTNPAQLPASRRPVHELPSFQDPLPAAQQLPAIRPPFMPPSTAAPTPQQPSRRRWDNHIVTASRQDNATLVNLGQASTDTPKNKKHHTMNQRRPQVTNGANGLVKGFQEAMTGMLRSAVARPGIVELKVNIGRILIEYPTIPSEYRDKPFEVKDWFHAVEVLKTEITGMLSTKSSDATNILNTKLSRGRRLFNEHPVQHKVTFVIEGQSKANEHIVIEVNEDRRFKIRGRAHQNGAINWHFVRRAWDAQLVLMSEEFIGGNYWQEVQTLVNSIKIDPAPHMNGLQFSFDTHGADFQIHSVILRRETIHTLITYPDLLLHLTEVQDLNAKQGIDKVDCFYGTIEPQDQMAANHRLWWEASISSHNVSTILKENDTLELGEKARWEPEDIIETGAVENMYALAQEIVTRIDDVGAENKGPSGSESKNTTKPSESHVLPTGPAGYW